MDVQEKIIKHSRIIYQASYHAEYSYMTFIKI